MLNIGTHKGIYLDIFTQKFQSYYKTFISSRSITEPLLAYGLYSLYITHGGLNVNKIFQSV